MNKKPDYICINFGNKKRREKNDMVGGLYIKGRFPLTLNPPGVK